VSHRKHRIRRIGIAVMALAAVAGMTGCTTKPEAGEIGVVRNGGPFDNHNIRQIVPNGSGTTWNGWWSSTQPQSRSLRGR
jgi:hypothetical protein